VASVVNGARSRRFALVPLLVRLDALAALWRTALDAALSALHAADPAIGRDELAERSRRLAKERSDIAAIVHAIARELANRHPGGSF
jgi:hypothetical protein